MSLFSEVHHETKYSENIYGIYNEHINFDTINNLYVPSTIDGCYIHDGHGRCEGLKKDGKWNTDAHRDRIVHIDDSSLKIMSNTFEDGADWNSVKLANIHAREILVVLKILSDFPQHVSNTNWIVSFGFDEAASVKKGYLAKNTKDPNMALHELVYSGPHIFIGSTVYKNPRSKCVLNSDYDVINVNLIDSDFVPRTNFIPILPWKEYYSQFKGFLIDKEGQNYDSILDYYKVAFREYVGSTSERTLTGTIIPKNHLHIGTVVTATFKDYENTIELAGLTASIVLDFFMKSTGSAHVKQNRINAFPLGIADKYNPALFVRTLQLNCLTKYYAELWQEQWRDEYKDEQWSIDDGRLKPFSTLTKEWQWETPLRNYFERRQALVEIDVISAMALGLSLKDLEMIYTIQFPVLQQNEADTWYDQKGNIVFTCSKGPTGVGCDRPEWNNIRGAASPSPSEGGDVDYQQSDSDVVSSYDGGNKPYVHTIDPKKSELYGGQQVTYYPPYTHPDRIADYRRAWAFFEERFNK